MARAIRSGGRHLKVKGEMIEGTPGIHLSEAACEHSRPKFSTTNMRTDLSRRPLSLTVANQELPWEVGLAISDHEPRNRIWPASCRPDTYGVRTITTVTS